MNYEETLDFICEMGMLKRVSRSGWWVAGVPAPESVAEHSFRTAVIGHVLARLEGVDPYTVVLMTLYNDIHESRINDLHKIGHRYIDFQAAEQRVQAEQLDGGSPIKAEIASLLKKLIEQGSPESVVARDADILECILQGKEYYDIGYPQTEEWFTGKRDYLHTESAQALYDRIVDYDTTRWRKNLRKFDR
ncbi:MAG: HD domain-containing protein [Candidatus Auribacterota bacterium]